jgi:hypothetical protein
LPSPAWRLELGAAAVNAAHNGVCALSQRVKRCRLFLIVGAR